MLKWQPETALVQIKLRGNEMVWYVGSSVCNITGWCCRSLTRRYINWGDYSGWRHLSRQKSAEFWAFKLPWAISLRTSSNKPLDATICYTKFWFLRHMNTKRTHRVSITKTSRYLLFRRKICLILKSHEPPRPPPKRKARAKCGDGRYRKHSGLKYYQIRKKCKPPYSKVSVKAPKITKMIIRTCLMPYYRPGRKICNCGVGIWICPISMRPKYDPYRV